MKKTTATSSNEKVITASANSGAAAAKYTISQAKAAKTASFTSEGSVASGEINLDFSRNVSGRSYTVEMTLDGTTKKITYTGGSSVEESKANFAAAANAVFSEVKGSNQGFEFKNGSALSFNGGADGIFHTFSVGYNVEAVGLSSTAHSRISTSSTLGTVGFAKTLKSDDGKYNININGVDFEFDNNTKISDMISEINKSDAGVKLSFSNVSQAFTLETKETGASAEINVYQTNGNLLNSLFNWSDDKAAATNADKVNITYEAFGSQTERNIRLILTLPPSLRKRLTERTAIPQSKLPERLIQRSEKLTIRQREIHMLTATATSVPISSCISRTQARV